MDIQLLKPYEVDAMLRYPFGRAQKLARKGLLPHVTLPDGEIRFRDRDLKEILQGRGAKAFPNEGGGQ